jgi:hypothetical protein
MASAKCFSSQHLTTAENGLFDVCMRITSGGKTLLLFDGRKMAARFTGVSKDVVYRLTASLVKKGWLVPINGNSRKRNRSTGMYDATRYQVIGHGDWVASHGTGQCAGSEPVAPARMEPFAKSPTTIRETDDHHSQNRMPPVVPARHSFVKPFEKKPLIEASVSESQDQHPTQDQKRALIFSNSKAQTQPLPIGGNLADEEFKRSLCRKTVTPIWRLYPGNECLEDQAMPFSDGFAIFNAGKRHGLKVCSGTEAFAAAVKQWSAEERKLIPPAEQWYSDAGYLKEPAQWTLAQS